jgi:ligand-binding SRPBCC domain-containing protein
METYRLVREQLLPLSTCETFRFFADAANLEYLTPPWLRFQIVSPRPIEMRAGTLIDYKMRLHGMPVRWRSEITVWQPPYRFVDSQRRGPYRLWVHTHAFESVPEGTLVTDIVDYAVPGGALVQRLLVRPDLERIFDYRSARLAGWALAAIRHGREAEPASAFVE